MRLVVRQLVVPMLEHCTVLWYLLREQGVEFESEGNRVQIICCGGHRLFSHGDRLRGCAGCIEVRFQDRRNGE